MKKKKVHDYICGYPNVSDEFDMTQVLYAIPDPRKYQKVTKIHNSPQQSEKSGHLM